LFCGFFRAIESANFALMFVCSFWMKFCFDENLDEIFGQCFARKHYIRNCFMKSTPGLKNLEMVGMPTKKEHSHNQGDQIFRILFTLGSYFETYRYSPQFGYTFSTVKVMHSFRQQNVLVYILGEFFSNTSGVDVMITIFCTFCQFSSKKLAFFLKTNVMIKILLNLSVFWVVKRQFFSAKIF
jgi:hypothetical protein